MLNGALARRYAQALFDIASETKTLEQVEVELKELTRVIQDYPEVKQVLHHPHIPLSEKKSLMDKLLGNEIGETVRHFLFLMIDRRRQDLLPLIQREFTHFLDEARQIVEAKVATAAALTADQEEKLRQNLARLTGKNVRMVSEIRPELIGGVMVQVGDRVIDGTVAHSLNRMREELRKSTEIEPQGIGVKG